VLLSFPEEIHMLSCRVAAALFLALGTGLAQVPDMSGTWRLNVEKSVWGKHPKPSGATVTIEHRDPSFKYSGTVTTGLGSETADRRSFSYEGVIDDKEYPVGGSAGQGTVVLHRVSANTITSERKGPDGKLLETARTTLTGDGKRLVREMKATGPEGEVSWTEIYDRQ
jgi:hypothetical protein